MRTNVRPSVRMCIRRLYTVHDPVRLRLRHLYQVEFCSFIVRYPTAGASVYCGHIFSLTSTSKKKCGLRLHLTGLNISLKI